METAHNFDESFKDIDFNDIDLIPVGVAVVEGERVYTFRFAGGNSDGGAGELVYVDSSGRVELTS